MNKEITIYDLLGLIKDGKPPKKIIYDNKKYFIEVHDYSLNDEKVFWLFKDNNIIQIMTKKVEILEENKPIIEKINGGIITSRAVYTNFNDVFKDMSKSYETIDDIIIKLNEVIDYINRKKDK